MSSRRSTSMYEVEQFSRQSSIDSSVLSRSTGSANKRPESVAQKILRERQNLNLKTRYLTESQSKKFLEHQRNRRRSSSESASKSSFNTVPLHIALRQTASRHTSRTQTASRIQQEAHMEAIENFKVILQPSNFLLLIFFNRVPGISYILFFLTKRYPDSNLQQESTLLCHLQR